MHEKNVRVKLHNGHLSAAQEEQPEHSSAAVSPLITELELKRAGLELLNPVGLLCRAFCSPHIPDSRTAEQHYSPNEVIL